METNPDISWYEPPELSNRFVALGEVARGATVSVFASAKHVERVRLSLPLAVRYLRLKERGQQRFDQAILARERNDVMDRFFNEEGTRLDQHIVLSSLFATSQPVSSVGMTGHDYVIGRDCPIRKAPGSELLVENPDGITVLDVMRNATLTPGEGLHERELLPFSGIDWDPSEWVDTTEGPQPIEVSRRPSRLPGF